MCVCVRERERSTQGPTCLQASEACLKENDDLAVFYYDDAVKIAEKDPGVRVIWCTCIDDSSHLVPISPCSGRGAWMRMSV